MTREVSTITAEVPAETAWQTMRQDAVQHLVVVDGKKVVGVISDHDLGGNERGEPVRRGQTVGDLMQRKVVTASEDTKLRDVANLLRSNAIGCLPVLDKAERLIGIVTATDVLELIGRGVERPVVMGKRWTLKHRGRRTQG